MFSQKCVSQHVNKSYIKNVKAYIGLFHLSRFLKYFPRFSLTELSDGENYSGRRQFSVSLTSYQLLGLQSPRE